jgi:glycosyltransferase involved in cell wall biosynthesis
MNDDNLKDSSPSHGNQQEGCPVISVIMPVFNCREYLPEALYSMFRQTYGNFELIAVDDGSDDGCWEYLNEVKDKRLRLFRTERKQTGSGNARNIAINHARGEYVALMDADDVSAPNRLERLLKEMEKYPDVVMCGSGVQKFAGESLTFRFPRVFTHECILVASNRFFPPSVILRRELLMKHNIRYTDFPRAQDIAFSYTVARYGKAINIPDLLYWYRWYGYGQGRKTQEAMARGRGLATRYMLTDFMGKEPTAQQLACHQHIMSPVRDRARLRPGHVTWLFYLCFSLRTWRGRCSLLTRFYHLAKYHFPRYKPRK